MKIRTLLLSIMIVSLLYVPRFYAGGDIENGIYLSDGKGSLYFIFNEGSGTKVWKYFGNSPKSISSYSDNFDKAFYSDDLYLMQNKGRLLYIMSDDRPEIAEIGLNEEFIMVSSSDSWYFWKDGIIIKYDNRGKTAEEIKCPFVIKTLIGDIESKKVFALTDKGIWDMEKERLTECEVPVMPLKANGAIYTDSEGNCYEFDGINGFRKTFDTDYDVICGTENALYALDGNEIYRFDGNGTGIYHLDFAAADIMASGNHLYALTETEAVYIDSGLFVTEESSVNPEISKAESSVTESSAEESSREISVQESSEKHETARSDVYRIVSDRVYIPEGTTAAQFRKNMNYGDKGISFTDHNGKNVSGGVMGTGWQIDFAGKRFYTVVQGDMTGEGNVNTRDVYLLRDYLLGKAELSVYQREAADWKKNDVIDIADLYLLVGELNERGIM